MKCHLCGSRIPLMMGALIEGHTYCDDCGKEYIRRSKVDAQQSAAQAAQWAAQKAADLEALKRKAEAVVLTTTPSIDGCRIVRYLGIESVEFVIGTGVFSEVTGSIADFFGARSSGFEAKLQAAKKQTMDALKLIAAQRGANAVVGVDLDYTEFSGNRIGLIVNGTLVVARPIRTESTPD